MGWTRSARVAGARGALEELAGQFRDDAAQVAQFVDAGDRRGVDAPNAALDGLLRRGQQAGVFEPLQQRVEGAR